MINEAILRPPKSLRNFIDFEIPIGTNKKQKKDWQTTWDYISNPKNGEIYDAFMNFLETTILKSSDYYKDEDLLDAVYKEYKYSIRFFEDFEKYLPKWKEIKDAENELNILYKAMEKDFGNASYKDKITSEKTTKGLKITYTFEDRKKGFVQFLDKISVLKDGSVDINFLGSTGWKRMTIEGDMRNKFASLMNTFIKNSTDRNSNGRSDWNDYNKQTRQPNKPVNNEDRRYNLLKNTLDGYLRQLKREKEEGKDTKSTENEIIAVKNKIQQMNAKHQFEHLKNFGNFTKY